MDNTLKLGKKAFTLAVVAATILWSLGLAALAPQRAGAAQPGDLVKGSLPAVFYYGEEGRYAFPNAKTYNTWFSNFNDVVTISDSELAAIPLAGANVMYRPGSRFVKVQSVKNVYAVEPAGNLRWIETQEVAEDLSGSAWNTLIDDVPEVFFVDYNVGVSMAEAEAYDGMMASVAGKNYLVWDGEKRMATAAGMAANNMRSEFFVSPGDANLLDSVPEGDELNSLESALVDPAQMGGVETDDNQSTPSGDLVVSLSSSSPASQTVPANASGIRLMNFDLTATGGDVEVDQIQFMLGGLAATTTFDGVYLYEGNTRLVNSKTFNSSTRLVTFGGLNWNIASGTTKTYSVVAESASTVTAGNSFTVQIKSGGIEADGDVAGNFPITSATHSTSSTSVGTITIAPSGTIVNPTLGQKEARIGQFTLTAGSAEGALVEYMSLEITDADNHGNYYITQNNNRVAEGSVDGEDVLFTFDTPFAIDEGDNKIFKVYADINGGKAGAERNDNLIVILEEANDLYAVGDEYGYGLAVTNSYGTNSTSCTACSRSTIEGGDVTIAEYTTASDIPFDQTGVAIYDFTITTAGYIEIRDLDFSIAGSDLESTTADTGNFQNFRLVDVSDGSTFMGPVDFDSGLTDSAGTIQFSDDQVIEAGTSLDLQLVVDVKDATSPYDLANDDTITATLDISEFVVRDENNDTLTTASGEIVPSADVAGKTKTVKTSDLIVTLSQPPASDTVVIGSKAVDVVGFNFEAADAEDVEISAITVDVRGEDTAAGSDVTDGTALAGANWFSSCLLVDAQTGATIDGPESPTTGTSGEVAFDGFSWTVEAGEIEKLLVRCDIANLAVSSSDADQWAFLLDASETPITATEAEGGDSITVGYGGSGGTTDQNIATGASVIITTNAVGTLSVATDGASPDADIILGNSTGVEIARYLFTASTEGFIVDHMEFDNSGTDAVAAAVYLTYENQAGNTVTKQSALSSGNVSFQGLDFYVPADDEAVVIVSIDTNATSTSSAGAASASTFDLDISTATAEFDATGVSSGAALDGDDVGETDSSDFELRKTRPTFAMSSNHEGGAAVPTLLDVLEFNVSADSRGKVVLSEIVFGLETTDNASSNWDQESGITVGDFSFYDTADLTTDLGPNGNWTLGDINGDAPSSAEVRYVLLNLEAAGSAETIGAGSTKSYKVRFDATGASSINDDTLRFRIPSEADISGLNATIGSDVLEWDDANTTGADIDADYIDGIPLEGEAFLF